MRYYIIAGEASGDLHASRLMQQIQATDGEARFRCWGGDLMASQGGELVKHYRDLAFMGFAEVIQNLGTILRNIRFCKSDLLAYRPDVLILVDYPGFNLRIARFAKEHGIKVVYYISPQVWAWKESRVRQIKRDVDKMLVILPFEKEFYRKHDMNVDFVGHPLLDVVSTESSDQGVAFRHKHGLDERPIIALLPGSRHQEINVMLPIMLSMVSRFPSYQFVIAAAPSQDMDMYRTRAMGYPVAVVAGDTYGILRNAHAALVTSGTATLEAALHGIPEVVCYKGNRLSYLIARSLVKIRFISLVNLIMDREVVKELIQDELNTVNLENELRKILDPQGRRQVCSEYDELKHKLGGPGAAAKAAGIIHQFLTAGK